MLLLLLGVPVGFLVGLALGATGGGGALVAVPLLVYVLGRPVEEATALSLVMVGLAAAAGAVSHFHSGTIRWRAAALFGGAGLVPSWVGAHAHQFVAPPVTLTLFGLLMLGAAMAMWRRAGDTSTGSDEEGCANTFPRRCMIKAALLGVVVGALTGFFGIGGGFIIVPALVLVLGFSIRSAVGTSLLIIAVLAAGGIGAHLRLGHLDAMRTALLAGGSLLGLIGGDQLARRIDARTLSRGFAGCAGVLGLVIAWHNLLQLRRGDS